MPRKDIPIAAWRPHWYVAEPIHAMSANADGRVRILPQMGERKHIQSFEACNILTNEL